MFIFVQHAILSDPVARSIDGQERIHDPSERENILALPAETVILLILPYWTFSNAIYALDATLSIAVVIIFIFTFYTSVAKGLSFKKKFIEMATISLGVAILNFIIGFLIKKYFGLDI